MSFVHCHTCEWEQDDFWSWHYNPVRCFLRDVAWLWRPRWIKMESGARDSEVVFTWRYLFRKAVLRLRTIWRMRWWTFQSWKRDRERGGGKCPSCNAVLCHD